MITVETVTDIVQYNRIVEFKDKVNQSLLFEAALKAGDKTLDYDTVRYSIEPIPGDGKCGCTKKLKVTLTASFIDEYIK